MPSRADSPAIADLRARIARLEGDGAHPHEVLPFGIAPLDRKLPGGGLALGCLHEVAGGGNGAVDGAAAACFTAGIAARTTGQVLWCVALQDLFAPGLEQAGLPPGRVDNRIETVRIGLAMPVRDSARLTRLLCDRIETIAPGFGIEIMSLTATLAEPLPLRQAASSLIEEGAPDLSGLIDTLANRVGARAVYRFAPVASDVPERSVRRLPALAEDTGAGWPDHWPRPSRLLARPEPIETMALLPDHPPNWFSWKGVRRRVRRADGPERIFGEWWKRDAELIAVRDYFRVEDDAGERFWIFRSGDGEDAATGSHRWFLHGIFG